MLGIEDVEVQVTSLRAMLTALWHFVCAVMLRVLRRRHFVWVMLSPICLRRYAEGFVSVSQAGSAGVENTRLAA
jgi:hypothetical protein